MSDTAGFESLVRPYVQPKFRPKFTPLVRPLPDVEQGKFAFTGSSSQVETLSKSEQGSWSKSIPVETRRTVTKQRVYQKKPDGTVEKENFVDVEHATEIEMREGDGTTKRYVYADPPMANNIENIEVGTVYVNEGVASGESAPP